MQMKRKTFLSYRYLDATIYFTKMALDYETSQKKEIDYYNYIVTSGIFLITSFLETNINEYYSEIVENETYQFKTIDVKNQNVLSNLWKRGIPRTAKYSILEKYEIALDVTESKSFDKSKYPYQDVTSLIKLRNALIHYEPIWQEVAEVGYEKDLEARLKGKYKLNPFFGPDTKSEPFFPNLCLSAHCLIWAVKSSLDLVSIFYKNIKNEIPFKNVYKATIDKLNKITA